MKRNGYGFTALLLVVSMVLVLALSACGGKSSNSGSDSGSGGTSSAADGNTGTATDLKPYEITMVFPASAQKDTALVEEAMNKIVQPAINATVKLKLIDWGAWNDKTNLMFASNEKFDLMFTAGWFGFSQQVAKKQFIEEEDLLDKFGPDIKSALDPKVIEGGKVNGHIYGVVANKEFAASKGMMVRKDLVDKYGIDLSKVKTMWDFEDVLRTIKEKEPNITPISATGSETPMSLNIDYGEYEILGDGPGTLERSAKDFKVIDMYETDRFMEWAKLMRKWYLAGYINKDAATATDVTGPVGAGKAFSYGVSLKPGKDGDDSRALGTPMIALELTRPYMTTIDATSAMMSISRTSKDPERAMMFLNLLYKNKDLLNALDWGIEGTHYVKKSDNVIDYPEGKDASKVGWNVNQSWMFGNQYLSYTWTTENPDKWKEYETYNANAEPSRALGFVFDAEPVKNEIGANNNVLNEYRAGIMTGTIDPETNIPAMVKKLKAAGMDKIIEEKQKQLDAWLAKQGNK